MEHNSRFNEITYLLKKYCINNRIDLGNVDGVEDLFTEIKDSLPKVDIDTFEMDSLNKINFNPLKYEDTKRYINKFNKYFSLHPQLTKKFKLNPLLWNESIKKNEKVVLRLVEYDGTLEFAYLVNGQAFLFDHTNSKLELIDNLSQLEENFDKGIGKKLDENLKYLSNGKSLINTRKISINYYGNLDGSDFRNCQTIHLFPAIVDDITKENNHQFTYIMYFESKSTLQTQTDNEKESDLVNLYYDTFQLCPPNC